MPAATVGPDWVVGAVLGFDVLELLLLPLLPPQPATATTMVNAAATAAPVRLGGVRNIEANSYAMSAAAGGSEKLYACHSAIPAWCISATASGFAPTASTRSCRWRVRGAGIDAAPMC